MSQLGLFKEPSLADDVTWTDDFFASGGNLHPDVNYNNDGDDDTGTSLARSWR